MWRGLLHSSTFRIALIYMLLFGVSVCVLFSFLYWFTAGYMARQADATIEAEITGLAEQYRQRGLDGLARVLRERVARNPGGAAIYLFAASDYRALAGNLTRWPEAQPDPDGWVTFELWERGERDAASGERPHPARAREFTLRGGLHLLVGRDIHELRDIRGLLLRALLWGLALTAGLALVGGIAMSRSTARRLEAINQTTREIMRGDLAQRVPSRGSGDDFDQLAESLNAMLDRIQELMNGVREVSDNIAHDLKTPLTRLRNHLEHLQRTAEEQGGEAIAGVARRTLEEADRLLSMFSAVLRIARIESRAGTAALGRCDLSAILDDVGDLFEPFAAGEGKTLRVETGPPIEGRGDPDLLFQAFANVVENAVKYSPRTGAIVARIERRPGPGPGVGAGAGSDPRGEVAVVSVADSGPGIPVEERERVFRRFYRMERSRTEPGNGLGLSLVAAVIGLHGGRVVLESNDPGLRISMVLPLPAPVEPSAL